MNKLQIKLIKSKHGRIPKHKATLRGLGLKRINSVVELEDTPSIRGMVKQVSYLVCVNPVK